MTKRVVKCWSRRQGSWLIACNSPPMIIGKLLSQVLSTSQKDTLLHPYPCILLPLLHYNRYLCHSCMFCFGFSWFLFVFLTSNPPAWECWKTCLQIWHFEYHSSQNPLEGLGINFQMPTLWCRKKCQMVGERPNYPWGSFEVWGFWVQKNWNPTCSR